MNRIKIKFFTCLNAISDTIDHYYIDFVGIQQDINNELYNEKRKIINPTITEQTTTRKTRVHSVLLKNDSKSPQLRFLDSIYMLIAFNTNIVCFLMIILMQISSRGFLIFPLTAALFLWGGLSIPAPSDLYWKLNIYYVIFVHMSLITYDFVSAFRPEIINSDFVFFLGFNKSELTKAMSAICLVMLYIHMNIKKVISIALS